MYIAMYKCLTVMYIVQVAFAQSLLEKPISVKDLFAQDEMIDVIGVTRGHGYNGQYLLELIHLTLI